MSSSSALVVAMFAVLSAVNRLSEREEYAANIHRIEDLAGYLGCIENGQTYQSLTATAEWEHLAAAKTIPPSSPRNPDT